MISETETQLIFIDIENRDNTDTSENFETKTSLIFVAQASAIF